MTRCHTFTSHVPPAKRSNTSYNGTRSSKYMERALSKAAYDQLKRAKLLGESLDVRIRTMREAAPGGDFELNDRLREDFELVSSSIREAGTMMLRAQEAEVKKLDGLTEGQLEEQLRHEIRACVASMSDEDWNELVTLRAKRKGIA